MNPPERGGEGEEEIEGVESRLFPKI